MFTSIKIAHYDKVLNQDNVRLDEACTAFFNWKDAVAENAEEYDKRIRKLKLLKIMKSIMENELNETQREIVRLHYLEFKSGEEIAGIYGINRSTVSRMIAKIENIFKENMKYVFEYSEMNIANDAPPIDISQAIAYITEQSAKTDLIGTRLKNLRRSKLLSLEQTALAVGLTTERLNAIEKSGKLSVQELMKLIFFFSVNADQIIFGV